MKITRRLILWGEAVAAIWAAHWLMIAATFLVFVSPVLKWVDFPFGRDLSGLQLPLLRNAGLIPNVYHLSFGILGIAVLTTGLLFSRVSSYVLAVGAAILLTLYVAVPCHIAFQQPILLRRLTTEAEEVPLLRDFTKKYLPENYGAVETIPKELNLYTTLGRFTAACSFLGVGWNCFGLGSLLIAIYSVTRVPGKKAVTALALICIPMCGTAFLLTRPLIAQYYFTSAGRAKARGRNENAIASYRKAMWWDEWHEQDIDIYATIGDLEKQAGFATDSPERHISKAKQFQEAGEYERAIFEFDQGARAGGALAVAARRQSARTRVNLGLALYRAGGVGAAVTNWQQALAEDPSQVYPLPFLIRGNYELGRYEAALKAIDTMARFVGHQSLMADAYSVGGDCYAKLGRDADARRYYNLSLKLDSSENHWAMTGLIGD